jgi:hypothetical protein
VVGERAGDQLVLVALALLGGGDDALRQHRLGQPSPPAATSPADASSAAARSSARVMLAVCLGLNALDMAALTPPS